MTEEMKFRAEVHVTCFKVCFSFLRLSVISIILPQLYVIITSVAKNAMSNI